MKAQKAIRIMVYLLVLLSVLLTDERVKGARMLFIALAWIAIVFIETRQFVPRGKVTRNLLRILLIPIGAPAVVIFALAGGDAVVAWLSSDGANQTAKVCQFSYREMFKIKEAFSRIGNTGDWLQFSGLRWFYVVILGAILTSVFMLVINLPGAISKVRKAKKLEAESPEADTQ